MSRGTIGPLAILAALLATGVVLLLLPSRSNPARMSPPVPPELQPASPNIAQPEPDDTALQRDGQSTGSDLSPAYVGDHVIRGFVTSAAGPVPSARVVCTPAGFFPRSAQELGLITATTNHRGAFEFPNLPRARHYDLVALAVSGAAEARVDHSAVAPLELRIVAAKYERIRFVDPSGRPIPVRGRGVGVGRGIVFNDMDSRKYDTWFQGFGQRFEWDDNELVYIYSGVASTLDALGPRELKLPGYAPTVVPQHTLALAEWPAVTATVVLTPSVDDLCFHSVAFPRVAWPAGWSPEDYPFALTVAFGDRRFRRVTSADTGFVAREDAELQLLWERTPVPFSAHNDGKQRTLSPTIADVAFLDVRFPVTRPDHPDVEAAVRLVDTDGYPVEARPMVPGRTRFGPIPTGTYVVVLVWDRPSAREKRELVLGPGLQQYEWK